MTDTATPHPTEPPGGARRSRLLAPATAVAAVVAIAAAVVALRDGAGPAGGEPPLLRLADGGRYAVADAAAAAPGERGARATAPVGGAGVQVGGTLPTGPDRARVHSLAADAAPRERVAALATALGISAAPRRAHSAWLVGDRGGKLTLRVTDGGGWLWSLQPFASDVPPPDVGVRPPVAECPVTSRDTRPTCPPVKAPLEPKRRPPAGAEPAPDDGAGSAGNSGSAPASGSGAGSAAPPSPGRPAPHPGSPDEPVSSDPDGTSSDGTSSSGAGSSGAVGRRDRGALPGGSVVVGVPATPDLPAPDAGAVRRAADPVLAALGLDDAAVSVQTYPGRAMVAAAPAVDGLPTAGFETRLNYDDRLRLVLATGWLATPAAGAEYPLISARAALERLPVPQLHAACAAEARPKDRAGERDAGRAACPQPALVITGARLGLALRWTDRKAALLVPAWLYQVRGAPEPMPAVAVESTFLAGPADLPGGAGPGVPEPGGLPPGSVVVDPAEPADAPRPAAPKVAPADPPAPRGATPTTPR